MQTKCLLYGPFYLIILANFFFKIHLVMAQTGFKSSVVSHRLQEILSARPTRLFSIWQIPPFQLPVLPSSLKGLLNPGTYSYFPVITSACFFRLCLGKCYILCLEHSFLFSSLGLPTLETLEFPYPNMALITGYKNYV